MKVLVVEDNAIVLAQLSGVLHNLGYETITAANGFEAIEAFESRRPDIVLMDMLLPELNGFEAAARIKAANARRWTPVIFVTGLTDEASRRCALEASSDGYYLTKPVSATLLRATLQSVVRELALRREIENKNRELERYYFQSEEENRLAGRILSNAVNAELLADPRVRHWINPATTFSGDAVAAARTPDNILHVILADGAGHGLPATICILPVIETFYAMTAKGFTIGRIAAEINRKMWRFLPRERFVAASLASIDSVNGVVTVWNGGNPTAHLLAGDGRRLVSFPSRHPPLGVMQDAEFDATESKYCFTEACELSFVSDGLIELENTQGDCYGETRALNVLQSVAPEARLPSLIADARRHSTGGVARDDVSVICVDCVRETAVIETRRERAPAKAGGVSGDWRFSLQLQAEQLKSVDVVPLLLNLASSIGLPAADCQTVFVILSELFNNALDHGVLQLDSRLKLQGMEHYLEERGRRLAAMREGWVEFQLERHRRSSVDDLLIRCRDSGAGFDHAALQSGASIDDSVPFGRGISLLRALSSSIEYLGAGNVAVVHYKTAIEQPKATVVGL